MAISRRIGIAVVTAALAAGSSLGWAGDPPKRSSDPPVDTRLLEFLGSVDSSTDSTQPDDGSWLAYLAQINIGKAAKAAQPPPSAQPKPAASRACAGKPGDSEVQDDD